MREVIIQKIKDRIIYHSDEKKHRFEIGKAVIDKCAEDIFKDLEEIGFSSGPVIHNRTIITGYQPTGCTCGKDNPPKGGSSVR